MYDISSQLDHYYGLQDGPGHGHHLSTQQEVDVDHLRHARIPFSGQYVLKDVTVPVAFPVLVYNG